MALSMIPAGRALPVAGRAAGLFLPALAVLILLPAGCRRYADFTLPEQAGPQGAVRWSWEAGAQPVLGRGAAGEWDAVDALNPSVVFHQGRYWNFYSGYDGKAWHTGLATSPDGLQWTKHGRLLSPDPKSWEGSYIAANGSLLVSEGVFHYWYQGGAPPRIGLVRCPAGIASAGQASVSSGCRRHPAPVLEPGPRGSWDERGVADPYVISIGGRFYMYYLGQDRARRQRLGVARSEDGVRWEKYRRNPVLDTGPPGSFDETGLGEPAVWTADGWYWMLYTARDRHEHRRMGLARSRDGVRWERVSSRPVFSGKQPWEAKVVCDASVLPGDGGARVWYGGGDKAEPAENLNGQIGHAVLRLSLAGEEK